MSGFDEGVTLPQNQTPTARRRPRWVYAAGREPDARFSLANERTYLAWIRTSLALMAAGVALQAFEIGGGSVAGVVASLLLLGTSIWLPVQAWWSWARTERQLRRERPLPAPHMTVPLSVLLAVIGSLVIWAVLG
ncbi:YidH family protein [Gordonia sp. KTR9]|uniref:YidH family protein n=1 Tax=Gordonia sp. KTR9 TaxID=337191 RepID=UPI00027DE1F0|nr:DUF202 domain-containing protein [Gordonia sp. KTR9]AFR51290.1 putative membrane protein [Gordonia sp. KTR9]